jgi:hypothetical protein
MHPFQRLVTTIEFRKVKGIRIHLSRVDRLNPIPPKRDRETAYPV